MLDKASIDDFYELYKKNILITQEIENTLLRKEQDEHQWVSLLKEKSTLLRALYRRNESALDKVLRPILNKQVTLTPEIAEALLSNIRSFCKGYLYDSLVTLDVLELLLPYYKEHNNMEAIIQCLFYMGYQEDSLYYLYHLENAIHYDNQITRYTNYFLKTKNTITKKCFLNCLFNRIVSASRQSIINGDLLYSYCEETLEMSHLNNPDIISFLNTNRFFMKSITCSSIIHNYPEHTICSDETLANVFKYAMDLYQEDTLLHDNIYQRDVTLFTSYHKSLLLQGKIKESQYFDILYDFYQKVDFDIDFTNPSFVDMPPFEVIKYLIPEMVLTIDKTDLSKEEISKTINSVSETLKHFIIRIPRVYKIYAVNHLIFECLSTLLTHSSLQTSALSIMGYLHLNRQITTAIHGAMVFKLSQLILGYVLHKNPYLCVGALGTTCKEDVLLQQEDFYTFLYTAVHCFDIGKSAIPELIDLQIRNITNRELEIIQTHPYIGSCFLEHIPSLKQYYDISLLHHIYYDKSNGYPESCKRNTSANQFFIDLISICDSIDAATDSLGRNYILGKNFDQVLDELIADKYNRYCGQIVSIIQNDLQLIDRLRDLTSNGRIEVYYEIYQYVEGYHNL